MIWRTLLLSLLLVVPAAAEVRVAADFNPGSRVQYGIQSLSGVLEDVDQPNIGVVVTIAPAEPESYKLTYARHVVTVTGGDESGAMYGCLDLADRIRKSKSIPTDLNISSAPAMRLRGACIGMQKTYILPGRKVYEYPYTSDVFPFFYDKAFWQEYLDMLARNRMNTLYLWNGHPFASLVKLPDYPYALEVSEEQFQKNVEMFRYITTEADKRGIWVVQQFYSIILSKPFAEKNGLETQLRASTPVVEDYMRKSIAAFVKEYPHVGLMPCLGEALQGQENQNRFLTDVILAGIKEGAAAAGLKEEPPVVIRTHATDLRKAMPDALKVYKNLYTEAKFNGESLTTWEPRGVRQQVHLAMSKLGSTHLINVHILANLEPFRYGAQRFIQKCVQAGRDRLGAKGVHLYPLAYWSWPDAPDKTSPPLRQWERDWIWFEAWGRYSWNPDIEPAADHAHWIDRLTEMYGTLEAAEKILAAYNDSGECAPRILRRFGITEGNRQTMSLGMYLDQLVNPSKYREFPELWESQAPPGERLREYAEREWNKQPHEGETPPQIITEVLDFSAKAVESIDAAAANVTRNREEFGRLRNDIHCIRAMSQNYAAKANAALLVLRYEHSHDLADMEKAATYLAESLDHFRELTRLTKDTYNFANTMQTSQRRIPTSGGADGKPANYHWTQMLPNYEAELADFQRNVESLRKGEGRPAPIAHLNRAEITLLGNDAQTYDLEPGAKPLAGSDVTIAKVAPELSGLRGIRFANEPIEFESTAPVRILIGYFKSPDAKYRKPPELETDALAAERGGSEPLIRNAINIESLPPIDVHAFNYPGGRHKLQLPGSGQYIIVGVTTAEVRK